MVVYVYGCIHSTCLCFNSPKRGKNFLKLGMSHFRVKDGSGGKALRDFMAQARGLTLIDITVLNYNYHDDFDTITTTTTTTCGDVDDDD